MQDLWDWRRRVADLYGAVRAADDPRAGWALWRATRDDLFAHHSQTPLEPAALAGFTGVALYDYDPALRFLVALQPHGGAPLHLAAGADGTVAAHPFARTEGLAALGGELTLYWIGGYGGGEEDAEGVGSCRLVGMAKTEARVSWRGYGLSSRR